MKQVWRVLVRDKAFAGFAVLILALGIGAVTTMFSVVEGVLLRPLAYKDPGRLYAASEVALQLAARYPRLPVNAAHFRSWEQQCRSCEKGAVLNPQTYSLTGGGEPEQVDGVACSWRLFDVLGVEPQLGRTFVESDDKPGASAYVVISDALWRRRFGADPGMIGKTVQINDEPHVLVGVLRPDFRFPAGDGAGPLNRFGKRVEVFRPIGLDWAKAGRVGQFNFSAFLRLKEGASPAVAEAEMTSAVQDAGKEMKVTLRARLTPLQEQVTGTSHDAMLMLLAAVGAVLLIVCVNLGNLMLVRANGRERDLAIRRSLGGAAVAPVRADSGGEPGDCGGRGRAGGAAYLLVGEPAGEDGAGGDSAAGRGGGADSGAAVCVCDFGGVRGAVRAVAGVAG